MNATTRDRAEHRTPRILVVDDDADLRAAVRVMLGPAAFEVSEAPDGQAGLWAFRDRPFDLVLCDLFMPERDGLEVLRALAGEFAGARVILMSGGGEFHGTVNLLPLATALGAATVLHKPFVRAELLDAVRRALALDRD